MYNTATIENITGETQRTIQRHIKQGHLEAELVNGAYQVTQKQLDSYLVNYLYSEERNKSKSNKKVLEKERVEFFETFLLETKKCESVEDLILKYASKSIKFPTFEMFKRFQVHQDILEDWENGLSYSDIVNKHEVSSRTVYNVIKSAKELR